MARRFIGRKIFWQFKAFGRERLVITLNLLLIIIITSSDSVFRLDQQAWGLLIVELGGDGFLKKRKHVAVLVTGVLNRSETRSEIYSFFC